MAYTKYHLKSEYAADVEQSPLQRKPAFSFQKYLVESPSTLPVSCNKSLEAEFAPAFERHIKLENIFRRSQTQVPSDAAANQDIT